MSSLNILGLTTAVEDKPKEPQPKAKKSTTATQRGKVAASPQQKFKIFRFDGPILGGLQATLFFCDCHRPESIESLSRFSTMETLTVFGDRIAWINLGPDNFSAVIRHADNFTLHRNMPKRMDEAAEGLMVLQSISIGPNGSIVVVDVHGNCGWAGVPPGLIAAIGDIESTGDHIRDVAIDDTISDGWVVLAEKRHRWNNIDEELAAKLSDTKDACRIPHLRGNSWFIQSEESWFSNNIPSSLFRKLREFQRHDLDAIAIASTGQWAATFFHDTYSSED